MPGFKGILKKMAPEKNSCQVAAILIISENLNRSSSYSWVNSHKKLESSNNYFSSYHVNKEYLNLKNQYGHHSLVFGRTRNRTMSIDSQTLKTYMKAYIYQISNYRANKIFFNLSFCRRDYKFV